MDVRSYARATATGPSAANAAQTLTIRGVAGRRVLLQYVFVSYSAAPAGGRLTVTSQGVTFIDVDVTAAGPQAALQLGNGVVAPPGQDVQIVLAAAGAGVVGKISAAWSFTPDE